MASEDAIIDGLPSGPLPPPPTDQETVEQLQRTLDNPRFELWNVTSVMHILSDLSGTHGLQAAELALQIMRMYFEHVQMQEHALNGAEYAGIMEALAQADAKFEEWRNSGKTDEEIKENAKGALQAAFIQGNVIPVLESGEDSETQS